MDHDQYDVAVIGGGPAGLSAALVLGRSRRRVVVIDAGEPRNAAAAHMQAFLTRDGMPPAEFLAAGRSEVAEYDVEFLDDEVIEIKPGFAVHMTSGKTLTSRRILVTTGSHDDLPDIPGMRERWGRDLLHCPYCHGWEVRDKALGMIGTLDGSVQSALLIRQWSDDVVFFTHAVAPTQEESQQLAACGIRVVDGNVVRLVIEDDRLIGVEMTDGQVVPRDAVFIHPPNTSRTGGVVNSLACAVDDEGFLTVDETGRTSAPGVWAAGNAVDPRLQVITAAGAASEVAIGMNADLVDEDVERRLSRSLALDPT